MLHYRMNELWVVAPVIFRSCILNNTFFGSKDFLSGIAIVFTKNMWVVLKLYYSGSD